MFIIYDKMDESNISYVVVAFTHKSHKYLITFDGNVMVISQTDTKREIKLNSALSTFQGHSIPLNILFDLFSDFSANCSGVEIKFLEQCDGNFKIIIEWSPPSEPLLVLEAIIILKPSTNVEHSNMFNKLESRMSELEESQRELEESQRELLHFFKNKHDINSTKFNDYKQEARIYLGDIPELKKRDTANKFQNPFSVTANQFPFNENMQYGQHSDYVSFTGSYNQPQSQQIWQNRKQQTPGFFEMQPQFRNMFGSGNFNF